YIGIQFHPEKSGTDGLEILNQALKGGFIND
ncbi:imidazole glycerol phosphate synthase subunit HisH, partial [Staphylococcus simulans]